MTIATSAVQTSKRILDLWFQGFVPGKPLGPQAFKLWFGGDKETDAMLHNLFAEDAERALVDKNFRRDMQKSSDGTLALTILLDQIPRNIFRGTPRPFVEFDPLAREVVKEALTHQTCADQHPVYRHVLYMPLEHSENAEDQATCVAEFKREYEEVEPTYKELFKTYVEFAEKHQAVILKFGRFPHRNEVLGRTPTDAEEAHLTSGGDRW